MNLFLFTLESVSSMIANPLFIGMLILMGIILFFNNKKLAIMQKMIMGDSINSALELTLSQIVLGIIAGTITSLILSYLGVVFNKNIGLVILVLFSISLIFSKNRFLGISYTASILGIASLIFKKAIEINIGSLFTFVGVINIINAILVISDGYKGVIPVFSKKDGVIKGGYIFGRCWPLSIVLFMAYQSITNDSVFVQNINTPNWWPILNNLSNLNLIENMILVMFPMLCVVGYSSITFRMTKKEKTASSGITMIINGIFTIAIAQLDCFGFIGRIIIILSVPIINEILYQIDIHKEDKGKAIFVSDEKGIAVLEVVPYSIAYNTGINPGDKIVSINEKKVCSDKEIYSLLKSSVDDLKIKIIDRAKNTKELIYKYEEENSLGMILVPKEISSNKILNFNETKK